MTKRTLTLFGLCISFSSVLFSASQPTINVKLQRVERKLAELRKSPPELYAFLLTMPKGGDLHNHLSGAVYAEDLVEAAAEEHLCVDQRSWSIVAPPGKEQCDKSMLSAAAAARDNDDRDHLINSLSLRGFVPGLESAHDHFFATFGKFQAIGREENPGFVAQVVRRAAEQNESYLELMAMAGGGAISALGKQTGFEGDFERTREALMAGGLSALVDQMKTRVDDMESGRRRILECDVHPDTPACRVEVRYVFQVLREFPKSQVFAQILGGFLLASQDPRVVSINLVQPEDGLTSMHDYHLHMQMVAFAHRLYPKVRLTLHAGELASGLVPPEDLRFHIREAVDLAGAERIGHGVDIAYESESEKLLDTMKQRRVAVEINLTSNDVILGVRGNDHPFNMYRKAGVPVVLCTDDEGVSRTHLTQEYVRATLSYGLSYADLKQIVRNSIEYSFLPGKSLWRDGAYQGTVWECLTQRTSVTCRTFLDSSEKAKAQADLEDRFDQFEKSF